MKTPTLVIDKFSNVSFDDGRLLIEFDSTTDKEEEMEAIVRAVNTHDELLEEVKHYRSIARDEERFSNAKRQELDDLIERAEGRK